VILAGYRELLRSNRSFRFLWSAQVVSFLGDWFNTIAVYTIVAEITGSGRAIAGVTVAKMLPIFVVMPIGGPLVDRFDRRKIMVATDVARAVLTIGLIVAHRAGSLPLLYAVLVVMMLAAGLFIPAQRAAVPQITTPDELARANGLSGGTWSVMLALGAAVGGWVTATFGIDAALLLDGGTFVASAVLLAFLPPLPAPGASSSAKQRSFVAGLRHLATHHRTAALALLKPLMSLGGAAVVLIPIYGVQVFPERGGPALVGALYSARGLGALVGSLVLVRIFGEGSRTLRRLVLGMFPLGALAYLGLAEAPSPALAAVAYFVAAIASGGNWVMSTTLLQRETDARFLGRVFSVEFGLMTLGFSGVAWAGGWALDVAGLTPSQVSRLSSAALVIPFLFWGGHLLRERRRGTPPEGPSVSTLPPSASPDVFEEAAEGQDSMR
jgi:MFS family permease